MIKNYEKQLLETYLNLPSRKLLNHQFELEEDYLAGCVDSFLHGKRYVEEFVPFSDKELSIVEPLIENNISSKEGKDLYTAFLLTKIVCNILNKYKR